MLTRAFKGYNVPKSKGSRGKIHRDLRVQRLGVSRTKGDPGLIARSRSLEGHSQLMASKFFLI